MERLADTDRLDDRPNLVAASPVLPVTCPACGRETDHLSYCGHCGTRLPPAAHADDLETPDESPGPEAGYLPRSKGARRILPRLTPALRGQDPSRRAVAAGFVLVLIALLTDQPGIAIAVAASVPPILTLISLARLDLYEEEPWRVLLLVGAVGVLGGATLSLLDHLLIDHIWLDETRLNAGAAGFIGRFTSITAGPPAGLLLLVGALTPLLGLMAQLAVPVWLRRWSLHRNEVMDGMALGAAAGGGFATGGLIVYVWPLIVGPNPGGGVADWTAALIALVLVRPLIFVLIASLVAAALWHYALTQRSRDLAIPLVGGLIAAIGGSFGALLLAPFGTVVELLWHALVLLALSLVGRSVLHRALNQDRRAVGVAGQRLVCPNCRRVTPPGSFCSNCGHPLLSIP